MDQSGINSTCQDGPKAKKLKTSHTLASTSPWAQLPDLILTEIFSMLNKKDRQNASSVCRNWRANYFQPRWFSSVTFKIQPNKLRKSRFLTNTFGSKVTAARIILQSLRYEKCVKELIDLLQVLSRNNNLKSLYIGPLWSFERMCSSLDGPCSEDLAKVANSLKMVLPRLTEFSMTGVENLSISARTILGKLSSVTSPGLARLIADPERYLHEFQCELEPLRSIVVDKSCILLFGSRCHIDISTAIDFINSDPVIEVVYK